MNWLDGSVWHPNSENRFGTKTIPKPIAISVTLETFGQRFRNTNTDEYLLQGIYRIMGLYNSKRRANMSCSEVSND